MRISCFGARVLSEEQEKKVLMIWTELRKDREWVTYVHGGSKGVQELILKYEKEIGGADTILFAPWHFVDKGLVFSPKLMLKRNIQILDNSDLVLLFDLEEGNRLAWTEVYCEEHGIDVILIKETT